MNPCISPKPNPYYILYMLEIWLIYNSTSEVTITAPSASIKAGDSGVLNCLVKANDVGNSIQWFLGDSVSPIANDGSSYTITENLATAFESDGITKQSTSALSILNFDAADAASYHCRMDYTDPILDDHSIEQALAILSKSNDSRFSWLAFSVDLFIPFILGPIPSVNPNDHQTVQISLWRQALLKLRPLEPVCSSLAPWT